MELSKEELRKALEAMEILDASPTTPTTFTIIPRKIRRGEEAPRGGKEVSIDDPLGQQLAALFAPDQAEQETKRQEAQATLDELGVARRV